MTSKEKPARVFVIERPRRHDVLSASKFGELVSVMDNEGLPKSDCGYGEGVLAKLKGLDFDPDVDYIVLAGPVTTLVIGISHVFREYEKIRALYWDSESKSFKMYLIAPRSIA